MALIELKGPPLPVDLEFKSAARIKAVFAASGLAFGRCFGSKSGYRASNPTNFFVPNANVFCRTHGKIWWGDLDLSVDKAALKWAAKRLRARLYVVSEFDGRFENADCPHSQVLTCAIWHTGGPTRIPGLRGLMREAKLSPADLALLLNITKRGLTGLHEPYAALKIRRRIDDVRRWIELGLPESWTGGWGRWLKRPNPLLAGITPLQKIQRDEELSIGKLLAEEWPIAGSRGEELK